MTDVFDKLSEVEATRIAVDTTTLTCCFEARTKRTVSGVGARFPLPSCCKVFENEKGTPCTYASQSPLDRTVHK